MRALLDADDVSVGYQAGAVVARNLRFSINPRERVALIGPNGAGKSSLLQTLVGALPALAGQVQIHGAPLRVGEFRPDLAFVFQHPEEQLFCPTLAEDVAFGPRNMGLSTAEVAARVTKSLAECDLTHLADRPVHQLSGGEKRRATIAGALAMRPHLLVLDEPSTGLDPRQRRNLITLLQSLPMALLIATHDLELALDLCPRVLILDQGRLCADGPAQVVLADAALMHAHGQEVPYSLRDRAHSTR